MAGELVGDGLDDLGPGLHPDGTPCVIKRYYDVRTLTTFFQHGDNPEHVLPVDDEVAENTRSYRPLVKHWLRALHDYESRQGTIFEQAT